MFHKTGIEMLSHVGMEKDNDEKLNFLFNLKQLLGHPRNAVCNKKPNMLWI